MPPSNKFQPTSQRLAKRRHGDWESPARKVRKNVNKQPGLAQVKGFWKTLPFIDTVRCIEKHLEGRQT